MKDKVETAMKAVAKSEKAAAKSAETQNSKSNPRRVLVKVALAVAILISGVVAVVTTIAVAEHTSSLRAARAEYEHLRELADGIEAGYGGAAQLSALDLEMLQINPDYVAWIRIDGTGIDYPVVRGHDNEKYLNTSFYGEENRAGAVFMDFRIMGDLTQSRPDYALRHIIIYGHNLREGGMFTDLRMFLDGQFLSENRIITLIVNDHEIEFEIFCARLTDVNDPAYFLSFNTPQDFNRFADRIGAPLAATQIITLSTCVIGGDDDARVIVQGHRIIN